MTSWSTPRSCALSRFVASCSPYDSPTNDASPRPVRPCDSSRSSSLLTTTTLGFRGLREEPDRTKLLGPRGGTAVAVQHLPSVVAMSYTEHILSPSHRDETARRR